MSRKRRKNKKNIKKMSVNQFLLIGVYDKLQKNGKYHSKLEHNLYIGSYETEPLYQILDLGLDAGLIKNGNTSVKIEVYQIPEITLKKLDQFKSAESQLESQKLFKREKVKSPFGDIEVYFANLEENSENNQYKKIKSNVLEYFENKLKNVKTN